MEKDLHFHLEKQICRKLTLGSRQPLIYQSFKEKGGKTLVARTAITRFRFIQNNTKFQSQSFRIRGT